MILSNIYRCLITRRFLQNKCSQTCKCPDLELTTLSKQEIMSAIMPPLWAAGLRPHDVIDSRQSSSGVAAERAVTSLEAYEAWRHRIVTHSNTLHAALQRISVEQSRAWAIFIWRFKRFAVVFCSANFRRFFLVSENYPQYHSYYLSSLNCLL